MRKQATEHIPLKIMVIDDSEFARKIVIQALESENFNVVGEASTVRDSTEMIGNTNANLAIIDVVMPDVNGIELARKLKEIFSDLHVIIMSSLSQDHIVLEAISVGAVDFLHKPFTKQNLIDSVKKVDSLLND